MVMRRLQAQIPTLDSLHLPPVFREVIKEKNGLIFVTGATGSGKTTTLAAMLNGINQTSDVHIITLEDPIEFLHPHLRPRSASRELGRDFYSFPDGLRAALRQAPKVVLVGEIRDRETMDIALTAGETGHAVFSTLHTISAGQTIQRILGMFTRDENNRCASAWWDPALRHQPAPGSQKGRWAAAGHRVDGQQPAHPRSHWRGETENRRLSDIIEAAMPMAGTVLNNHWSRPTKTI